MPEKKAKRGRPKITSIKAVPEGTPDVSGADQRNNIEWCEDNDCPIPIKHIAHDKDSVAPRGFEQPKVVEEAFDPGVTGFGVQSVFTPPEERQKPSKIPLDVEIKAQ